MGKVKSWLMSMEEDATWMSRDGWAGKHGSSNLRIYDEVQDQIAHEMAVHRVQCLNDFIEGR